MFYSGMTERHCSPRQNVVKTSHLIHANIQSIQIHVCGKLNMDEMQIILVLASILIYNEVQFTVKI